MGKHTKHRLALFSYKRNGGVVKSRRGDRHFVRVVIDEVGFRKRCDISEFLRIEFVAIGRAVYTIVVRHVFTVYIDVCARGVRGLEIHCFGFVFCKFRTIGFLRGFDGCA